MRSFTPALAFLFTISQVALAQDPLIFDAGLDNQMGLVFSPDGDTAFRVAWDGRWLYFVSNRPASDDDTYSDGDIWRYCLADSRGLERLAINSDKAEYSPIVTTSGTLYFASTRDGGYGQGDLYMATWNGRDFNTPTTLEASINSATGEWNLWVSADETEMIFEASSRATNISASGDLYYSYRSAQGWEPAVPLGRLNTSGSDLMPRMHPDNETLYFTTAPIGGTARIRVVERSVLSGQFGIPR